MPLLHADHLTNDPDFQKGKKAIIKAVEKHCQQITSVRPPQTALIQSYEALLKQAHTYRGLPLFYPYLGSGLGNGAFVELADGSIKYDFISGIGVHFGHNHPKLIEASLDAAVQNLVMQGNLQQNRDALALSKLLVETSKLDHCLLTSSGAMANENALKMIFQKHHPADRVLSFKNCFIGRTLSLSQITDRPAFREGLPKNLHVDYIPFFDAKDPEGSTQRAIKQLMTHIEKHPKKHACMCFEMIQGEGGNYPGDHHFFMRLIDVLKAHDIAVLVDEVQTFGRTQELFAFQTFGLQDVVDIVTAGKLLQVCATLYTKQYLPRPGLISQTYIGATSSIHAATAIIFTLLEEGYLGPTGKLMQLRKHFVDHLEQIAQRHPDKLCGPYGYGLMVACTPFGGDREKCLAFAHKLFDKGVIAFLAGQNPSRLRFLLPAGGITTQDLDGAIAILEEVLCQM